MTGSSRDRNTDLLQCVYCGKQIRRNLRQCPYCREALLEVPSPAATRQRAGSGGQFRTGLLLMLMSGVVQYFVGGYSAMTFPVPISSAVTTFLVPFLFLSGLGLALYGMFLRVRA